MNLSRFVPRFLLLVGTVWFGPALHAQAAAGGVDVGSLLNPAVALNSLPTELAKFYPIFQVIGFLLLCIGLVVSLIASNSVQDNIKAVVKACLLTGTIALIPVISGQISSMASGVAQGFDQSGLDTATNLLTTSIKLNEYFQQSSQIGNGSAHAAEQAKQASWWQVPIVYMKGAIQDVKQGVVSMLTLISYIPESLARFCLFLVCMLGVLITYMVQYILGMVQYFLLNAALIFMPVFVAGLGTQFYRSQSANFISGWIGVACWPIGWGLWNIGTGAFCNLIKTFVADLGGLGVPAGAAIGSVVPGVGTVAGATAAGLLTLIVLAVFCLLLFVWVVAGAFIAPLLIQKMVTSGSNFFAGAMAAGGGAAAATVGTALKVGASFAAPGVGTAAAASAGASMQALGRGISGGGVDVGSMMGAAVPSMSDLADPAGAPSGRMYPKSETARRSAARSALRQVMS